MAEQFTRNEQVVSSILTISSKRRPEILRNFGVLVCLECTSFLDLLVTLEVMFIA